MNTIYIILIAMELLLIIIHSTKIVKKNRLIKRLRNENADLYTEYQTLKLIHNNQNNDDLNMEFTKLQFKHNSLQDTHIDLLKDYAYLQREFKKLNRKKRGKK